MSDFYLILALLTAGLSLAIGSISFFVGLKRSDRTYLVFGLMGLCMAAFLLLPPVGFIIIDQPPYPIILLFKRVFIFTCYGLFPWFIISYTGYKRVHIPPILSVWVVLTYCFMFVASSSDAMPVWSMMAILGFVSIFVFGLISGISQYQTGDSARAKWFISAVSIYGIVVSITIINLATSNAIGFVPLHSSFIPLMIIMGTRIVMDVLEKQKLEKLLKSGDERWHLLMKHAQVFVMELDRNGNILYVNDFGLKLLEYTSSTGVVNKNWFETFVSSTEIKVARTFFDELLKNEKSTPTLKYKVHSKLGKEITLTWTNFLTVADTGEITGVMNIGRDVSTEENAFQIISQLKSELHK